MHVTEPLRDHIMRNLESAIDRLNDDFERVEFWATALSAFLEPIPSYHAGHNEFLLGREGDGVTAATGRSLRS